MLHIADELCIHWKTEIYKLFNIFVVVHLYVKPDADDDTSCVVNRFAKQEL